MVNAVVPFKTVSVKNNTSKWFDGKTSNKIHTRDKLYKRFKLKKLHVDEEIYEEAQNIVQNLIRKNKKAYFEEKLKENTHTHTHTHKILENIKTIRSVRQKVTFYKYLP